MTASNVVKRKHYFRPRKSKREVDGSDVKITDFYAPCFDYQGNLVAVIKVGEDLSNITQNLQIIRRNVVLTVAFAILVGVILSIIIAHFLTKKIARLRNATDLVAALLNEMTKEPASDVPVKITPERPLPRRNHRNGRSGHGYRGPRDHRHNNYGGHRRRNRDGHSRSRRHDNHGKNHSSRHAFNIRHRED